MCVLLFDNMYMYCCTAHQAKRMRIVDFQLPAGGLLGASAILAGATRTQHVAVGSDPCPSQWQIGTHPTPTPAPCFFAAGSIYRVDYSLL